MSTLLERLTAMAPGETLDWRRVREEIHDEHDRATTTAERVTLLEIYEAVMDQVERSGVQDLKIFKEARRQDYALLIAKESLVGENVCAETLDIVTEREVAAGRMAPDDPVRQGAVAAITAPHFTRAELVAMEAKNDGKDRSRKLAKIEDEKSPVRRKLQKHGWWVGIVIVAIAMVSLKWYWLVEVSQPIETTKGVTQRADVLEKVLDYDGVMENKVPRGKWAMSVLLWPAEPTEEEIDHAGEFVGATMGVYDHLRHENGLCVSKLTLDTKYGEHQGEIALAQVVIDYLKTVGPAGSENGPQLIAGALTSKFPCK